MTSNIEQASKVTKTPIKAKEQRKLHAKSGNRCALCGIILVDHANSDAACIGENAHIYGEQPDAARYDVAKLETFVNSEKNLIFLCCNCHKKIDTEIVLYPPEALFDLKSKHESKVVQSLADYSVRYTFAELEVLTTYLVENSSAFNSPGDYTILKIGDKIKRNSLEDVQTYINMGLSSVMIIEDYVNRNPDHNFANRLANSMSGEYTELKSHDYDAIDIFYSLWDIACGGHKDFEYKAAGLGILVYFFEKCEVFEK